MTPADVISRLKTRYGNDERMILFQAQLSSRYQKEGEGIPELVDAITYLLERGYPGEKSAHRESLGISQFLNALTDREVALQTRITEPKTLAEASRTASKIYAYKLAERNLHRTTDRTHAKVRMTQTGTQNDERTEMLEQRLTELERRTPPHRNYDVRQQYPLRSTHIRTPRQGQYRQQQAPQQHQNYHNNHAYRQTNQRKQCYACFSYFHEIRNCPQRNRQYMNYRQPMNANYGGRDRFATADANQRTY